MLRRRSCTTIRRSLGGYCPLAVTVCLCLGFACAGQAQSKGETQTYNGSTLVYGFPFACNVDGGVFTKIADCVTFLTTTLPAAGFGGVITSNVPEHITASQGLPWDPGRFSGVLMLGRGGNSGACPMSSTPNCWLTEVPIIMGSGMSIVGSGKIVGSNFSTGTAIVPGSAFPTPLGQPNFPAGNLSCATGTGGSLPSGTYFVEVVEVNNLDTNASTSALAVPGFSAVSAEQSVMCSANNSTITVTPPSSSSGSNPIAASDYRVFAASSTGAETLQAPGAGMTCVAGGMIDPAYACKLGSLNTAAINSLQANGDPPNLIDLSNPLVVEIGPVISPGTTSAQNEGFWALLQNLTLALPGMGLARDPNVAFWNPSDQENSGLSFVNFTGQTSSLSGETGAWIYIGNHAPNSFVSNVQTDTNPPMQAFYGMILDGRNGFGSALGTARLVENSTFTPGRCMPGSSGCNPSVLAGIYVTGNNAVTDFDQVHVETPSGADSNFEVTNGASVSVRGPTQFGNTVVHLTSNGTGIRVANVFDTLSPSQVVKDDLNGVNNLGSYVADYTGSVQGASVQGLPSIRDHLVMDDEFFSNNVSGQTIGSLGWANSGTGTTTKGALTDANHPGQIQRSTGTSNNVVAQLSLGDTNGGSPQIATLNNVAFHAWFVVQQDPSSIGASTNETWIVGFVSNPSTVTVANGIYFSNVSGGSAATWTANCTASSTTTFNTSTVSLDTNWHTFEVINDGSNHVTFKIDGAAVGAPITMNIPTVALTPTFIIKNTDSTNKVMNVDAFRLSMAVTR